MKTYARIVDGRVAEIIPEIITVDGVDVPLAERYHPDFIAVLVEYDPANPPVPPVEPTPVPVVPAAVTARQARLALLAADQLSAVASAIAALPDGQREAAQIEWEYASTVERESPLVLMLGAALGLDLDALFLQASTL